MADEKEGSSGSTTGAYAIGMFMIILAAIAVAIFVALLIYHRDQLSIDNAGKYPRDTDIEIELKDDNK